MPPQPVLSRAVGSERPGPSPCPSGLEIGVGFLGAGSRGRDSMGLFLGQGFIEVEHRAGGDRPGGQFHRVQAGGGGVFAGADPLGRQFGLVRVSGSVALETLEQDLAFGRAGASPEDFLEDLHQTFGVAGFARQDLLSQDAGRFHVPGVVQRE